MHTYHRGVYEAEKDDGELGWCGQPVLGVGLDWFRLFFRTSGWSVVYMVFSDSGSPPRFRMTFSGLGCF